MTKKLFQISYQHLLDINPTEIVILGDEDNTSPFHHFEDIDSVIKYISKSYGSEEWWFIGGMKSVLDMTNKGLVTNIHITKTYDTTPFLQSMILEEMDTFDTTVADEFELVSNTKCRLRDAKMILHYLRVNVEEKAILSAMSDIIHTGYSRSNRTKVDTRSLFGRRFEYEMVEKINKDTGKSVFRLPLLTTKRMFTRGVFAELKWMLSGQTNSKILEEQGINIWKGNSSREYLDSVGLDYEEGECGPIYGFQWRHFGANWENGKSDYTGEGIDQVANVIESLQKDPFSRRHIIDSWNSKDLSKMALPPCHVLYNFIVHEENNQLYLSLMMTQRSCDVFLGLPFNICSLGMFLVLMSHRVNMKPFKIVHNINDFHLYETHIDAAYEQTLREPCMFPYISITCEPKDRIENYNFSDIKIEDYHHHGAIQADMVA